MKQPLMTPERKRTFACGSFETDGANAPVTPRGDGTVARTAGGTYTVTFDRDMGLMLCGVASLAALTGDQYARAPSHAVVGGVSVLTLTIIDNSGAALADVDGPRLNWEATFSEAFVE